MNSVQKKLVWEIILLVEVIKIKEKLISFNLISINTTPLQYKFKKNEIIQI